MKRANNLLLILIIFLSIVIIGLTALLVLSLLNIKEKPYEKETSVDKIVNEKIIEFLNPVVSVSGNEYYNILDTEGKTDEELFDMAIKYLYLNELYTSNNDEYVFNQLDIVNVAKKYMLKDSFTFIPQNPNYIYNDIDKTIKTKSIIVDKKAIVLKSSDIYEKTETKVYVMYEVKGYYIDDVDRPFNNKYSLIIENKNNNEFKLLDVAAIK